MKEDAGGGGRQTIRVHRVAALVQIGIAVPFLVMSGVMIDRVRTAELGFATDGLAATRLPTSVDKDKDRAAGFPVRRALDNLRRPAAFAPWPWPRACRLTSMKESFESPARGREVCHGARHARRRELSRDHRREAASRADDHGRGPHDGGACRGDFRTARQAAVSRDGGDWPTRDGHDGREQDQEFTVVGVSADFATSQLTTDRPQILLPMPDLPAGARRKRRLCRRRCF
jgi:hypothetical protein